MKKRLILPAILLTAASFLPAQEKPNSNLENALNYQTIPKESKEIEYPSIEKFLTSGRLDANGFFIKMDSLQNKSSVQGGFNNELTISPILSITPGIKIIIKEFTDLQIEGGAHYKIPLKKGEIEPYTIGIWNYESSLKEIRTGISFEKDHADNFYFSIEPGYDWNLFGHKFKGKIGFGNTRETGFNLGVETYFTKSIYKSYLDKFGFIVGINFTINNFLTITGNIKIEKEDYKETQRNINILSSIKF